MTSVLKLDAIRDAAKRIQSHAHVTPILTSETLNGWCGGELFFKCENLQKAGAFKARGALNAVFSLIDAEAEKGVITHSSGNHAAALARLPFSSIGPPALEKISKLSVRSRIVAQARAARLDRRSKNLLHG